MGWVLLPWSPLVEVRMLLGRQMVAVPEGHSLRLQPDPAVVAAAAVAAVAVVGAAAVVVAVDPTLFVFGICSGKKQKEYLVRKT